MGIYYKAVCRRLKQEINPPGNNKFPGLAHPESDFTGLVLYAMGYRWSGNEVELINDMQDEFYEEKYEDITQEVIDLYNADFETDIRYTP